MKALSFRQPWAELILQGRKTMDLRTMNTHHRGLLAIHASQTVEEEACWEHELNPENLDRGGVVGVVEVVGVVPLDEAAYEAEREAHLAGRRYKEGLYGWKLANPRRLPKMVVMAGRMGLFNVELDRAGTPPPGRGRVRPAVYQTAANGNPPGRPFTLRVVPQPGGRTDYALSLEQQLTSQGEGEPIQNPKSKIQNIATLGGDNLRAVASQVIEALRQGDYKATDLSPERVQPFYLPEAAGVRLGLVLLAVKPVSKAQRVEAISHGIRQMPPEEVYYWYSKCTAAETAERAQKALRVLLAAE